MQSGLGQLAKRWPSGQLKLQNGYAKDGSAGCQGFLAPRIGGIRNVDVMQSIPPLLGSIAMEGPKYCFSWLPFVGCLQERIKVDLIQSADFMFSCALCCTAAIGPHRGTLQVWFYVILAWVTTSV